MPRFTPKAEMPEAARALAGSGTPADFPNMALGPRLLRIPSASSPAAVVYRNQWSERGRGPVGAGPDGPSRASTATSPEKGRSADLPAVPRPHRPSWWRQWRQCLRPLELGSCRAALSSPASSADAALRCAKTSPRRRGIARRPLGASLGVLNASDSRICGLMALLPSAEGTHPLPFRRPRRQPSTI